MNTAEAIEECKRWLDYLDKLDEISELHQQAQAFDDKGREEQAADLRLKAADMYTIFDSGQLGPAVRRLVAVVEWQDKDKNFDFYAAAWGQEQDNGSN